LTAGGEGCLAQGLGEDVRSTSDAEREPRKSASCLTDGDREVVGVSSLELALGDAVRSTGTAYFLLLSTILCPSKA
jgi:hypothetical protein